MCALEPNEQHLTRGMQASSRVSMEICAGYLMMQKSSANVVLCKLSWPRTVASNTLAPGDVTTLSQTEEYYHLLSDENSLGHKSFPSNSPATTHECTYQMFLPQNNVHMAFLENKPSMTLTNLSLILLKDVEILLTFLVKQMGTFSMQ